MRHASERRRPRRALVTATVLGALCVGAAALAPGLLEDGSPAPAATTSSPVTSTAPAPTASPRPTPEPSPEPVEVEFTILAGGDVLPHLPLYTSAATPDGLDFSPLLAGIDAWVEGSDLALCHMEVPVVPEGQRAAGYPMFGADPAVPTALAEQGWDACSTASNHSLDKGFDGLVRTLDVFDSLGMGHVGTARDPQEADEPQTSTVTVDGVATQVAQISATYGTNGLPIPADKPWSVQLIDTDQLAAQARAARAAGADIVLASIHDGQEYLTTPTADQVRVAEALAASGEIDMVIGHHAHVPQPLTRLPGGPDGSGMWVVYGHGNMLSNQDSACCVPATSSGILTLAQVRRTDDGPARIAALEWVGITVDRVSGHRMHVLADVPDGVGSLSAGEIAARYARVREAVGTEVPERTEPPAPAGEVTVVPRPRG
ncbi:MAG: CapA family protein [Cellulomonadaceae bacterium]